MTYLHEAGVDDRNHPDIIQTDTPRMFFVSEKAHRGGVLDHMLEGEFEAFKGNRPRLNAQKNALFAIGTAQLSDFVIQGECYG